MKNNDPSSSSVVSGGHNPVFLVIRHKRVLKYSHHETKSTVPH
jgi:hypothetical protein